MDDLQLADVAHLSKLEEKISVQATSGPIAFQIIDAGEAIAVGLQVGHDLASECLTHIELGKRTLDQKVSDLRQELLSALQGLQLIPLHVNFHQTGLFNGLHNLINTHGPHWRHGEFLGTRKGCDISLTNSQQRRGIVSVGHVDFTELTHRTRREREDLHAGQVCPGHLLQHLSRARQWFEAQDAGRWEAIKG